jgi:hypothetical protein
MDDLERHILEDNAKHLTAKINLGMAAAPHSVRALGRLLYSRYTLTLEESAQLAMELIIAGRFIADGIEIEET